ncbi:hypothetical protein D3C81_970520 [compost metagenome]
MIGSISLLVMIISITPMHAVTPSSCTIGMSISMITAKPRAFISNANDPGMKILQNAECAACWALAPATTSCFQALVICTACDTPIEKIRNGTRIDIGSIPSPSSGNSPSSQTTGSSATTSATRVRRSERAYSHSNSAVITNAITKKPMTVFNPSTTSPTSLAKPTMLISICSLAYLWRMSSRRWATSA